MPNKAHGAEEGRESSANDLPPRQVENKRLSTPHPPDGFSEESVLFRRILEASWGDGFEALKDEQKFAG